MILRIRFFRLLLLLGVGFTIFQISTQYRYFLWATFNEFFTPWNFRLPGKGEEFYVQNRAPRAMQRMITRAFPEYKVIFTSTPPTTPHLILKEYYTLTNNTHITQAPYLAYSGEYDNLRWKRYFPSGYPFLEITARYREGNNFIFMPYIVYGKPNLRHLLTEAIKVRKNNQIRSLQVAYISSHCIKERDTMFRLLKERFKEKAISLGKCSRTPGYEASGTYHDLKDIYKQYNFGIAMENHERPGYLTEKIANVFEAGAIPIYWGDADLARHFFNPDAFIDIKKYKNFEAAAKAVGDLANNPHHLQAMLRAPLFTNNKIPPFLLINDNQLTNEEEAILQEMAQKLRKAYDDYLHHKQKLRPYWKALEITSLLQEKIHFLLQRLTFFF
jgi:hypothetical protein